MENYMYLVPVAAVLALLFAAYLAAKVSKQDAGTDRMKEILIKGQLNKFKNFSEFADEFELGERDPGYFCSRTFCTDRNRSWKLGNSNLLRSRCSVFNNRRILRYDRCNKG